MSTQELFIDGTNAQVVNSLPVNASNNQIIRLQNAVMEPQGVIWELQYRAGASSSRKWEFIGGSPMQSAVLGSMNQSTVTTAVLTGGPNVTVPVTGYYNIDVELFVQGFAAGLSEKRAHVRTSLGGGNLVTIQHVGTNIYDGATLLSKSPAVLLNAGDVLGIYCQNINAIDSFYNNGFIQLTPERL